MTGIYARQSVDKKDSISVETQIELCRGRCQGDDIKIYTDRGFSGRNLKRPAYIAMMKDISQKTIDRVIVYRLDRLSRSVSDFSRMCEVQERQVSIDTGKLSAGTYLLRLQLHDMTKELKFKVGAPVQ